MTGADALMRPTTFNAKKGRPMKPLKIGPSYELAFSADGDRLTAVSRNVGIWDLSKRSKVVRVHPFSHPDSVDFSPDGANLAAKNTSGHIVVISAETGETIISFKNTRDGEESNLCYSSCGEYLIDGTWDGSLSVRRADSGEREFLEEFRQEMIVGIYRSDSGNRWIVAHHQKWTAGMPVDEPFTAYFSTWDWPFRKGGYRVFLKNIQAHDSSAITSDGALLAIIEDVNPRKLSVYEVATGVSVGSVPIETGGGLAWVSAGRLISGI